MFYESNKSGKKKARQRNSIMLQFGPRSKTAHAPSEGNYYIPACIRKLISVHQRNKLMELER